MAEAYQRGIILYRQRRYKQAAEEFRRELQTNHDNAWAHGMLALSLSFDDQHDAALAEGQTAVASAPSLPFAHYALANVVVRKPFGKRRHFTLNSPQADAARRLKLSRKSCLEAVKLNSDYSDALGLLSAIEFDLRRFRKSVDFAERGLRADPNHQYCANMRGRALHALGNLDAAESTYDRALKNDPENTTTHTNRGFTRLHKGDFAGAINHFREALRLDPANKRALKGLRSAKVDNFILIKPFAKAVYWVVRTFGRTTLILAGVYLYFAIKIADSLKMTSDAVVVRIVVGGFVLILIGRLIFVLIARRVAKWKRRSSMPPPIPNIQFIPITDNRAGEN